MEKLFTALGGCLIAILIILGLSIICAYPTMWLWNWLMPLLFKLPTITVLQAWGLTLLCSFLIKGFNITFKK